MYTKSSVFYQNLENEDDFSDDEDILIKKKMLLANIQDQNPHFMQIQKYVENFVKNQCICVNKLSEFESESEYKYLLGEITGDFYLSNVHQFLDLFSDNMIENPSLAKYWHKLLAMFIPQVSINDIEDYVIPYCSENYKKEGVGSIILNVLNVEGISTDLIIPLLFKLNDSEFVQAYTTISFTYPHLTLNSCSLYHRLIDSNDPRILVAIRQKFSKKQIIEYGTQEFVLNKISKERAWQAPGLKFLQATAQEIGNIDEIGLKIFDLSNSYLFDIKEAMINYFHHYLNRFSNNAMNSLEHKNFLLMIFNLVEGIICPQYLTKTLEILLFFLRKNRTQVINLYSKHTETFNNYATKSKDSSVKSLAENILKTMKTIKRES